MTGYNIGGREEKSGINQRNRRQTTTRTGSGMTMEQLIRETRKEVYRAQKKEAISNRNTAKRVPQKVTQQQQVISRETKRYLTSAVVRISEDTLTANLQEFCCKIPSGSYKVKVLVRKNKVSVRMTCRGEQPLQQQPDTVTAANP